MTATPIERQEGEVIAFPRDGFVLGDHLCRQPGPKAHLLCFAEFGHDGDHSWGDWRGCHVRVDIPGWPPTIPFGGFAQ